MLFLLMQLDGERYVLDIRQVAVVLPLVDLRAVPGAPTAVAGIIDYGGAPVPVIDLARLLANRPAHRRLGTRIVLVHYAEQHVLGLIAEHATETVRKAPSEFQPSGITRSDPPHLGPVALDATGPVHWIDVSRLLPGPLADSLFRQSVDS
jgi:chemotaxis-related protein WspB